MTAIPHYHVGYVVPDVDVAMELLAGTLGMRWTEVTERPRIVHTEDGTTEVRFRVVYSVQGPPYMELVEQIPSTLWSPPGQHHVGFWSEDVRRDSNELAAAGLPRAAWAETERPGAWRWAYHRQPFGGYIELVDRVVEAELAERLRRAG